MAELKEREIRLLEDRLKNLNMGLNEMGSESVMVNKAMLTAVRDYMAQLLCLLRRPSPSTAPLTLDELRKMDGEPVWCAIKEITKDDGFYGIIEIDCKRIYLHGSIGHVTICWDVAARKLRIYRRKPEEDT